MLVADVLALECEIGPQKLVQATPATMVRLGVATVLLPLIWVAGKGADLLLQDLTGATRLMALHVEWPLN